MYCLFSWYIVYGVAHESLTCRFFMPLLVAFRQISSESATEFSGRKHACALVTTCGMAAKSNVACNNIKMMASFSATCVCDMGACMQKVGHEQAFFSKSGRQTW
jgi:hypothetical protein